MGIVERPKYQPLLDDPDDYRPRSRIAIFSDPGGPEGEPVQSLSLIFEECAPGDSVPLHIHPQDEAVVIDDGAADYVLGGEKRRIKEGAVVFVPRGTVHGLRNPGPGTLRFHGILPSTVIGITYRERNPRPGTEGQPPQRPQLIDIGRSSRGPGRPLSPTREKEEP